MAHNDNVDNDTNSNAAEQLQLQEQQHWWAIVEAEMAIDASRRAALVAAVVSGDLGTVKAMVEEDHDLAFHTLNRKTTLLVRIKCSVL